MKRGQGGFRQGECEASLEDWARESCWSGTAHFCQPEYGKVGRSVRHVDEWLGDRKMGKQSGEMRSREESAGGRE
eukprot:2939542-Rhodomonas_salina.1